MGKILIIDDEIAICDSLEFALEDDHEVYSAQEPAKGLELLVAKDIDLVLLDLRIGSVDGLEVLKKIKSLREEVIVIILTAYGSIKSSVEAMSEGAYHYLTKPLNIEELTVYVNKGLDYKKLNLSLNNLKKVVTKEYGIQGIIGKSKQLKDVLDLVDKVKDIDSTVLIAGESGTGKELIAKAIHFQGKRKDHHFEVLNCAAIPANLLESELFGYEKGAFTGANKKRTGKIELAHQGTLFLDEIGEMDLALQAKILRVVQDRQVVPLGAETGREVDVRIVAATNKDLAEEVKKGNFREDLYFRLNVITLKLPPLRERKEDIPLLLNHFLQKYNLKLAKTINRFSREALALVESYEYPGNIRELENMVERIVALTDNEIIQPADLPDAVNAGKTSSFSEATVPINIGTPLKEVEKKLILATLDYFDGNRRQTAACLGISERNLQYKIKEYEEGH